MALEVFDEFILGSRGAEHQHLRRSLQRFGNGVVIGGIFSGMSGADRAMLVMQVIGATLVFDLPGLAGISVEVDDVGALVIEPDHRM